MATTAASIATQLDLTGPSPEETARLEVVLAVAQSWVLAKIIPDAFDEVKVQEAILLYGCREYISKYAPSGAIDQDGFQSQGFVPMSTILGLLEPFLVWNVG